MVHGNDHLKEIPFVRRGFLSAGVPVFLKGTGGPRAPHCFEIDRRGNLGCSDALTTKLPTHCGPTVGCHINHKELIIWVF